MSGYSLIWAPLLLAQAAAFPFTRRYGLYSAHWYTDVVLHILAGVMFAAFWLWLVRRSALTARLKCFTSLTFAAFASFAWELWEFAGWRLMGHLAPNYIPTLSDTLGDVLSGLLGGVILCMADRLYER